MLVCAFEFRVLFFKRFFALRQSRQAFLFLLLQVADSLLQSKTLTFDIFRSYGYIGTSVPQLADVHIYIVELYLLCLVILVARFALFCLYLFFLTNPCNRVSILTFTLSWFSN